MSLQRNCGCSHPHIFIYGSFIIEISAAQKQIPKVNTFSFTLLQWIVNSCCFYCSLGIFCKKRRNCMVWSPVPMYSFIRGLCQWLVHLCGCAWIPPAKLSELQRAWACMGLYLIPCYTAAERLWSSSVLADLWINTLGSQYPSLLGLPLSVLHSVGAECSELRVMGRNLFAPFANPLSWSLQWNPLHKGFSDYRTIAPSQ